MFTSADDYDRFMGRYSVPLAREFSRFACIESEQTVLDDGCGSGALTGELVRLVGGSRVSAVDPSPQRDDGPRRPVRISRDREADGGEAEAGPENISGEEVIAHSEKEATPTAFITQEDPL